MLSVDELRNYQNWIGRSPEEIRGSVIVCGGWGTIFPRSSSFPLWASRIRNYFNQEPAKLLLLGVSERSKAKYRFGVNYHSLTQRGLASMLAYSGDVYKDETGRPWFEISTGGTYYHYEGEVSNKTWYKTWEAAVSTQKSTPVFKLTSPDKTGGSLEVCIHNWQHHEGRSTIGPEGKWINVRTKVVLDEIYKGSYNYSETGTMTYRDHKFRDIASHREQYGFYLNPPSDLSTLLRQFPSQDRKGREIVDSERYF